MSEPFELPTTGWRTKRRTIAVLVAGTLILIALVSTRLLRPGDELRHITAKVQRGGIRDLVDATGTVAAVITVQVGSQVSGTIASLNADFNTHVRKGVVVATIDSQLYQGVLQQALADLENARAGVVVAQGNLTKARASRVQMEAEFDRAASMVKQGVGTPQALDLGKANFESAKASVSAAEANVDQARAQVSQKEAAVSVSRTNLAYTTIRSPIDGVVVARNVDIGQTVAASLQAPTIFTIAQDLTKMLVYAKVDESDVGRIRSGQHVTFKVDAFPKDVFLGDVREVRMNPTTVQNVVTYDAVIEFANRDLKLFPGMTAYVAIPVATVEDVLEVPNAALRYKPPLPPEAVQALYSKYGIEQGVQSWDAPRPGGARSGSASRPPAGHAENAVVWKRRVDGSLEPVETALGITDHTFTQVTKVVHGSLGPGDDVVTSSVRSKSLPPGAPR
jgi:HlyD family secretion protein